MGFSGTLERMQDMESTKEVSRVQRPIRETLQRTHSVPSPNVILYWYSTIGWLLLNTLASAMLVDAYRFNSEYQSAQQFAVVGLIANLFGYVVLIRGLMTFNKPKGRISRSAIRVGIWLGEGLGIAIFTALVMIGGAWMTLWVVSEFG